jgi:ATP-binding cassette subfamily C (CFTR/MRP) protein 1
LSPSILSVIPSALLIVLGLLRILHLIKRPCALGSNGKFFYVLKVFYALALLAADATALATSPHTSVRVASALALIASLVLAALSHFEHWNTRRSSILLPLYLLATVLCDVVRVRTFALTGIVRSPFFAALCASLAVRCCMNVTENIGKAALIKDRDVAPEETATFVSRLAFGCTSRPI